MNRLVLSIILAGLVFRLFFVFSAYHGDLNNNISWGNLAVERGLLNYYEGKTWPYSAPNQPPLYIILFGFTSLVWKNIESLSWWLNNNVPAFPSSFIWFWESKGMMLIVKLPSIFADLGIGVLIYQFFKKLEKEKLGINLMILWLFNPVVWYNSTVWGQTDPIVNLFGLISILLIIDRKILLSLLFLTISILFKGSLIIFLPLVFLMALYQRHKPSLWIKSIILSFTAVFAISFWFHPFIDLPMWLFNLYTNRIFPGEIGYLTANAFNLWWIIDSGKVLDSQTYLNIPFRIWGFILFGSAYLATIFYLVKSKFTRKSFLFALTLVALTSFMFMTRMHERYLYPFLPLSTVLLGFIPELLLVYITYSFIHLINLYHLFWIPSIPWLEQNFDSLKIGTILAVLNIIFLICFVLVSTKRKSLIKV